MARRWRGCRRWASANKITNASRTNEAAVAECPVCPAARARNLQHGLRLQLFSPVVRVCVCSCCMRSYYLVSVSAAQHTFAPHVYFYQQASTECENNSNYGELFPRLSVATYLHSTFLYGSQGRGSDVTAINIFLRFPLFHCTYCSTRESCHLQMQSLCERPCSKKSISTSFLREIWILSQLHK